MLVVYLILFSVYLSPIMNRCRLQAIGVFGSFHQISAQFELFTPNLYLVV